MEYAIIAYLIFGAIMVAPALFREDVQNRFKQDGIGNKVAGILALTATLLIWPYIAAVILHQAWALALARQRAKNV